MRKKRKAPTSVRELAERIEKGIEKKYQNPISAKRQDKKEDSCSKAELQDEIKDYQNQIEEISKRRQKHLENLEILDQKWKETIVKIADLKTYKVPLKNAIALQEIKQTQSDIEFKTIVGLGVSFLFIGGMLLFHYFGGVPLYLSSMIPSILVFYVPGLLNVHKYVKELMKWSDPIQSAIEIENLTVDSEVLIQEMEKQLEEYGLDTVLETRYTEQKNQLITKYNQMAVEESTSEITPISPTLKTEEPYSSQSRQKVKRK